MPRLDRVLAPSRPLFAALAALALVACEPPDPMGEASEGATSVFATTGSTSSSGGETETVGEASTSGGDESTSTGDACVSDEACGKGYLCDLGACVFDPEYCGDVTITVPITPPNVMLVLDKSGSMVINSWDGDGDPQTPETTRWYSLVNVVEFVVASFDGSMNLGMTLFPSTKAKGEYTAVACLVDAAPTVAVEADNGASILASMPPAEATSEAIAGGTPTRAGMIAAITHLEGLADELEDYIILVTDGAANCSLEATDDGERFEVYDEALDGLVADAYGAGIRTFVVGVDIADELSPTQPDGNPDATNTFERLNALALAGGVPKDGDPTEHFYNAKNQVELQAALEKIVMTVLPCELELDPPPVFPDHVEVKVSDHDYGKGGVTECAGEDGWMYATPEHDRIVLCGSACSTFQESGVVEVLYKCPIDG
ncbi:MAG: vWA domain-containing protein [Nannocystaceae bacterium]